jgi:shikimate kinase
MKLFLLGYMGSGKTTIGKSLAGKLSCSFSDLDEEIEKGEGMTVREIFSKRGEEEFRKLERDYLLKFSSVQKTVVAAGGGTPCFLNNMDWMNKNGMTVYLKVSPDTLFGRLRREKESRPLIKDLTDAEMKKYIYDKVEERKKYYSRSHLIVECDNKNKSEIIKEICICLKH